MHFKDIIGQNHITNHLESSVKTGRIPHAQLFIGKNGFGTLPVAIAYAQLLLTQFSENPNSSDVKVEKLQHPDLHFAFPVTTNDSIKKHPISDLFLDEWRSFVKEQPYGSLFRWLQSIGVENKQGLIGVDEAQEIVKKLQLKSYEGGFKVMIIWMADKMNIAASNKLLKLIEEPPSKTVFILITENEEQIISTIKSRCQTLYFAALSDNDIIKGLIMREAVSDSIAAKIAQQADGDYEKAIHLLHEDSNDLIFEQWFIAWVRTAFRAKGNTAVVQQLVAWADSIASKGRETQKQFLNYCLNFFRQALLINYKNKELVYLETKTVNFDIEKFAPFVHSNNILEIQKELEEAFYHIERNGNAKIIMTDLSLKLTRLLHKKEEKA